jgi:hypothetical protein
MRFKRFPIVSLVLLAAVAAASAVPAPPPAKPIKDVLQLEKKLIGTWYGVACDGEMDFNSDGTYQWRNQGPGFNCSSGKWEIRWDAIPPTLILNCKKSDFDEMVGKSFEMKITKLDDSSFSHSKQCVGTSYKRDKK